MKTKTLILSLLAMLTLVSGCGSDTGVELESLEFVENDQQYPKMMIHLTNSIEGNAVQHASVTVEKIWTLKRNACFITQVANWHSNAVLPLEQTPYNQKVYLPYPLSVSESTGIPLSFGNDGEPGHYYVYLVDVTLNLQPSGDDVSLGRVMYITDPPFEILGGPSPCVDGRKTYVAWKKTIAEMESHLEGSHIEPKFAIMLKQAGTSIVPTVIDELYKDPDDEENVRYNIDHLSMLTEVDDAALTALEAAAQTEHPLIQQIAKETLEQAGSSSGSSSLTGETGGPGL